MHARTKRFQLTPEKVDDAVGEFEQDHLPKFKEQQGYKGFTLLANHATGDVIGVSFWESQADVQASNELGRNAGERLHQTGGGTGEVAGDEWEVLVDHTA